MKLKLKVISNTGNEVINITLKQESATLGRSSDNTLVLEDSDRYISGRHAVIDYQNSEYLVSDTSTNGVMINNATQPIGKGNKIKLNDGDQLRIGEYIINVNVIEESQVIEIPSLVVNENTGLSDDPFGELDNDSVQGMIDENQWKGSSNYKEKEDIYESTDSSDVDSPDSDFFDLNPAVDNPLPKVEQPPAFKEALHISPEVKNKEKKVEEKKVAITSDLFGEDWFTNESGHTNNSEIIASELAENEAPFPPQKNSETVQTNALIDNFLRGAGFENIELTESLSPESFYMIGKIFRASIQGAMDVLGGRAKIKNEMHLDVTMIRSEENNPIKLSVSAEEAIRKLLAPQDVGYLPADEAIEEAFDDIRAHQFSVIAGMQTALFEILKRFDPQKLEQRFQQKNPIRSSIPIHKQAKLWDSFANLYNEIEEEATDNFYRLFGQVFAESYEQQMKQLKNSKIK
jgi:type VI secretion system protein